MADLETAWLAGLLEGEGSFGTRRSSCGTTQIRIMLSMTDEDVVNRAAALMGGQSVRRQEPRVAADGYTRKPCFRVQLACAPAALVMERILPYMGARRSARITHLLGVHNGR